jgi:hypothetical protein
VPCCTCICPYFNILWLYEFYLYKIRVKGCWISGYVYVTILSVWQDINSVTLRWEIVFKVSVCTKKQQYFLTALTTWSLQWRNVFSLRYEISFQPTFFFLKKVTLMRSPFCLPVFLSVFMFPPNNFWTSWCIFMKFSKKVMSWKMTSTPYFLILYLQPFQNCYVVSLSLRNSDR